ncbi:MAG: flagellar basal-body MS-ring/collar protein FliF [Planctomycetota bacterium]
MAEIVQNMNHLWQRTSLMQRVVLIGVAVACLAAVGLLVNWASQPKMSLLFSELDTEEAGKIVRKIDEMGVAYELRGNGTSIYVAEADVHQTRLSLAAEGLPVGGGNRPGFKLLDESKIGMSPFMQEKTYFRALEGEIGRTIQLIDGVISSRVHIVQPASPLLGGQGKKASASVVVQTRRGYTMGRDNVSAIVHLVAGSVEGLANDRVAVVDHTGKLLSQDNSGDDGGKANGVLDLRGKWEDYFVEKIEAVLKPVLGPERVAVRVDVELDMTSSEEMVELAQQEGVTVEELIKEESSVQPVQGNDNAGAGEPAGQTRKSETKTKTRPLLNIRKVVNPAGTIKSRHVAVVVDLTPPKTDTEEGEDQPADAGEKIMSVEEVRRLVARAIGVGNDQEIEDSIEVVDRTFQGAKLAGIAGMPGDGQNPMELYFEIARRSSLGLLVVGALVALRIFRGPRTKPGDMTITDEANALPDGADAGEKLAARDRISRALQENPEQVKKLFLSWAQAGSDDEEG